MCNFFNQTVLAILKVKNRPCTFSKPAAEASPVLTLGLSSKGQVRTNSFIAALYEKSNPALQNKHRGRKKIWIPDKKYFLLLCAQVKYCNSKISRVFCSRYSRSIIWICYTSSLASVIILISTPPYPR